MLSLVRVDNRLIHGQVVEAWLPHVHAERVAVADDEAANSMLVKAAMGIAVGDAAEVLVRPLDQVDYSMLMQDGKRTVLLFRDVAGVVAAYEKGLRPSTVNLGNVHFQSGRKRISQSVYLNDEELQSLESLRGAGVNVEVQSVPSERPVTHAELVERFRKG